MSLLLQALQKAARNREGGGPDQDPEAADSHGDDLELEPVPAPARTVDEFQRSDPTLAPAARAPLEELTIAEEEDLFGPDALTDAPAHSQLEPDPLLTPTSPRSGPRPLAPSSAHAASIMRASEARSAGVLDWVRDRPVHTFAMLAGVFLAFYAIYVYLQIAHPGILRGDFLSQPLQAKSPPPVPPPAPISAAPPPPAAAVETAPEPAAAPIAGMPSGAEPPAGAAPSPALAAPAPAGATGAQAGSAAPRAPGAGAPGRTAASEVERSARASRARTSSTASGSREPAQHTLAAAAAAEPGTLEDSVAVRTPERAPDAMPSLLEAWDALQRGRYDEADGMYQAAAQIDPDNVDVLLGLAAIAVHRGQPDQAARHYAGALEREPRNATAQAGLISIIGQSDPQTSETRLKQLIAREPSGFLYFGLGNLYAAQGQWAQAQQAYYQAYQLQPDHPDYAYNLAIGLEHLGQPKIALNYYRRALELTSQRGHASFDRGRVQERVGQLTARVGSD